MTARQKKNDVTGEVKIKLDTGVKALRGFLFEFTNEFDNDPLAQAEAAARRAEEREQFEARVSAGLQDHRRKDGHQLSGSLQGRHH
jgi:hypothetical protein